MIQFRLAPVKYPYLLLLPLLLFLPASASAEPPALALPIDCQIGVDCYVQNFADVDPGPDHADYHCGPLSYDGHQGTDFRLATLAAMRDGVAVLAAAPGVVRATRDGMPDSDVRATGKDAIRDREVGNAVVIRHDDGWETQYSHLKQGSIRVAEDDRVDTGDVLGLVGLSGLTAFPHLHFAVRHKGQTLDPFTGQPLGAGCTLQGDPLWTPTVAETLRYQPSALLSSGFTDAKPTAAAVRDDPRQPAAAPETWSALIFWVDLMGVRVGDRLQLSLHGPDGTTLAQSDNRLDRNQAQRFQFVGKRRPAAGWPPGTYRADMRLWRFADGRGAAPILETAREWRVD